MTVMKTKPPQKTAVVWTKSENQDGIKAANLLRRTGAKVEVREIGTGKWKKSDVEAAVPGYTSLPQIVVDGAVVGDLAAVKAHPQLGARLKKPTLDHAARAAAAAERAVAAKSVVKGRLNHPTEEQNTAALARAVAAKAARAEHAAARVARVLAARPARG